MNFRTNVMAALAATCAAMAALPQAAFAQPDPSLAEVPLPRLQAMVLPCDLKAPAGQPPSATSAEVAFCAAAADELRRRGFDGDRERLLGWWERSRAARRAAPSASRPATPQATRPVASATRPVSLATPAQVKAAYLHCNRLAEATLLDFGTAARCSMVYEDLKRRVFDGDFQRLLAWSREQQAASASAAPTALAPSNESAQAAR